jgi:hypothetical protein
MQFIKIKRIQVVYERIRKSLSIKNLQMPWPMRAAPEKFLFIYKVQTGIILGIQNTDRQKESSN